MSHVVVGGKTLHFGRAAPKHDLVTMRCAIALGRALEDLGPAPYSSTDWTAAVKSQNNGQWEMLGNDTAGCCVIADDGHYLMLRTANVGSIVVPTTAQILGQYAAETGYVPGDDSTDNGTNETDDTRYMIANGLLGHKADAGGMIDPANLEHIKWAVQAMGRARLGILVPQYLMDQFDAGDVWHYDGSKDQAPKGGHDVPLVRYLDPKTGVVVTWGKEQLVDLDSFFDPRAGLVEEAHAEVFSDWITKAGTAPSGFDHAALVSKLKALQ
jgi:hypothetical protein